MNLTRSWLLAGTAALCAWPRAASSQVLLRWGVASPDPAAPRVGGLAPEFKAPAVLGGKTSTFDLRRAAAADGLLLLYFFPAAFTQA